MIARRVGELTAFQDPACAEVRRLRRARPGPRGDDRRRRGPHQGGRGRTCTSSRLTRTSTRSPGSAWTRRSTRRYRAQFGDGARYQYRLHPPVLRALGLKHKVSLGPWFRPAFVTLAAMRRLRGTRLDPFGRTEVRRTERALITEYREVVEQLARRPDRRQPRPGGPGRGPPGHGPRLRGNQAGHRPRLPGPAGRTAGALQRRPAEPGGVAGTLRPGHRATSTAAMASATVAEAAA